MLETSISSNATLVLTLMPAYSTIAGPVLAALITGVGGVLLGKYLSDKAAKEQLRKSITLEIIQRRIRLAERAIYMIHRANYFKIQHERLLHAQWFSRPETYRELTSMFDELRLQGDFTVKQWQDRFMAEEEILSIHKETNEATAEFATVANLCGLYFGPKTRNVLDRISKGDQWFLISMEDRGDLISSLFEELYYGA
jgi:hypothetical protein